MRNEPCVGAGKKLMLGLVAICGALLFTGSSVRGQTKDLHEEEVKFLSLLNAKRKELGKVTLVESAKLTAAARVHSKNMLATDMFDHRIGDSTLVTRVNEQKYPWRALGENISMRLNAQECFDGWMKSDFHRKNMLSEGSEFVEVGISRIKDGEKIRWTLVLGIPEEGTEVKRETVPEKKNNPIPEKKDVPANFISVSFVNETNRTVSFLLYGRGIGEFTLKAGESFKDKIMVNPGVQPAVFIIQPDGKKLGFGIADGGKYSFGMKDGRIENFYAK